jgi:hypothetical protein
VKDRKLVVNESEAATVRMIFERFAALGSASTLARAVQSEGIINKRGKRIDKGFIYKLINNRVYLGEAVHKGTSYPGEHDAIITQELWERVHGILKVSPRERRARNRNTSEALLKGLIFTSTGAAMTPTYTRKGDKLYHYYTSMDLMRMRSSISGSPLTPGRRPGSYWTSTTPAMSSMDISNYRSLMHIMTSAASCRSISTTRRKRARSR